MFQMIEIKIFALIIVILQECNINLGHDNSLSGGWKIISSLEQMQHLVEFEEWTIRLFTDVDINNDLLHAQPKAVSYLSELRKHYEISSKPYIHHPFNQLHLIKRFALQWKYWEDVENVCMPEYKQSWCPEIVQTYNRNIRSNKELQVDYEQVHFTMASMIVSKVVLNYSQNVYITGNVSGVQSPGLDAFELLEIAVVSIAENPKASIVDLRVSLLFWLNTAVEQYIRTQPNLNTKSLDHEDIVLEIFRAHDPLLQGEILSENSLNKIIDASKNPIKEPTKPLDTDFPSLCRKTGDRTSKLDLRAPVCRYLYWSVPYFRFPAEFLSQDPPVVVLHNFLDKDTIMKDRNFAQERLWPASVGLNKVQFSPARITQHAMLPPNPSLDFLMEQVAGFRRVQHAEKNRIGSLEDVTYINYGVQGFYANHYDFVAGREAVSSENRLATLMWYASDVKSGGATVFPYLGVVSQPKIGKALLWFNIRDNQPDFRMLHASCPMGVGNKWISTVWVHQFGHDHLLRCRRNPDSPGVQGRLEEFTDLRNHFATEHAVHDYLNGYCLNSNYEYVMISSVEL